MDMATLKLGLLENKVEKDDVRIMAGPLPLCTCSVCSYIFLAKNTRYPGKLGRQFIKVSVEIILICFCIMIWCDTVYITKQ